MDIRRVVVTSVLKGLLNTLCKIDAEEFRKTLLSVAADGKSVQPMILAINHINFLEMPVLVTQGYPLLVSGLAKDTTWKNPIMAFLFDTYQAIPINRRGAYLEAFEKAREMIERGFFMIVAPEGTRSGNGVLGRGKAGIVQLALSAGVPILPVVHFGGEKIWQNMKHFKRTPFHLRVGRPFRFKCDGPVDKITREQLLEELMGQMAALLPEDKRGVYAGLAGQKNKYLEFL
ncbi:MAG: 1-acyl-sn-glycerol-3-phosphate acyltransferase [Treponema sp.]|jgi:1-acyl-sn-glycerol-3-phosphate acyltransferase|nr:1-acyl-sn-glycerol-3-phosphate acyltransferase [Treponema sp.]